MKFYKLLTQNMTSHNDTKWELNIPMTVTKEGIVMCTDQVLHCYNHPLLAIMLNPIHANISNPRLFEINVDEIVNTDGLKYASKSQTLIKEIVVPKITTEQKVEFAIRVAKLVCKDTDWNTWADNWLDQSDRSKESDAAAYNATYASWAAASAAYNNAAASANAASANAASVSVVYYAAASAASAAMYAAANAVNAYSIARSAARAASAAMYAAAWAADIVDKNKFNKQMIEIIESIIR